MTGHRPDGRINAGQQCCRDTAVLLMVVRAGTASTGNIAACSAFQKLERSTLKGALPGKLKVC